MAVERLRVFRIARFAGESILVTDGERVGNRVAVLVELQLTGVVLLENRIGITDRQPHRAQTRQYNRIGVLGFIEVIGSNLAILGFLNGLAFVIGFGGTV